MEYIIPLVAVVIALVCRTVGAVPSPWVPMGFVRRTSQPSLFYLCVAAYVLIGGLIALEIWSAT